MKSLLLLAPIALVGLGAILTAQGCLSKETFVDDNSQCMSDTDCDDGNLCTTDACGHDHTCSHTTANVGMSCGHAMTCNGSGKCGECLNDADCGESTDCNKLSCVDKACKAEPVPAAQSLPDDAAGDCMIPRCDGQGTLTHVHEPSDVPMSADTCTSYTCGDDGPKASYAAAGTTCGAKFCDGVGACVECVVDANCGAAPAYCNANACASCTDNTKNGDETDVDCGGAHCLKCNGEACGSPTECKSASCVGSGKCGWGSGVPCTTDSQCASLHCEGGACTAP
ncbi:Tryptophan synthase alpha chain [Minicystis rosea]|nr:Tryptophan synthase alpha chain [Minicystis rosea]